MDFASCSLNINHALIFTLVQYPLNDYDNDDVSQNKTILLFPQNQQCPIIVYPKYSVRS